MSSLFRALSPFLLLSALMGCGAQDPTAEKPVDQARHIVAVNSPLAYFAGRLLGGISDVIMPAPAGTDPSQWRPGIADIESLQAAELVLLNGAGYSPWLSRVALSDNRTINTGESVRERWIALDHQVSHSHGPEGEHAHSGYAFTTWMDLALAAAQAQAMASALQAAFPDHAEAISAQLVALLEDLRALDSAYAKSVAPLRGRQVIYSHPVYQYFEARYQLPGLSLHWEPDSMPDEKQWSELEGVRQADTLFIWESEPDSAIADRLRSLGVEQVTVDPGANIQGDWLQLQHDNVRALQSATGAGALPESKR